MMLVRFVVFIAFVSLSISVNAQEIKGKITNKQGETIEYATIYIEELQTGTSANHNGNYDIHVSPGTYTLSVRSLGYSPTVKVVTVSNSDIDLDIELDIQSYILAGVTVRADNEDPAYSIMRKSIARAPGFINQTKSFTSEVYIKGSLKFNNLPRLIAKQMEVNGERPKEGATYVNESINKITFTAPDNYEQEVISVNNTFPITADDVPVIGMLSNSIYESVDDFYISPFAANAFSHYKYSYEGLLQDGSWFIDKIKVTPKRKSKLLVEGYLYIVEDLWCLYSYELKMNPLYTELEVKQHYAPVKGNAYLPVNLFAKATIQALGVKADANYTTTIKYLAVELNPSFAGNAVKRQIIEFDTTYEEPKVEPKVAEVNQQIEELLKNDDLNNREMVQLQKLMSKKSSLQQKSNDSTPLLIKSNYNQIVHKDALVRDSLYWDSVRPVPASEDEKISYRKVEEKEAKDDSASMAWKIGKTILFGNYEWERKKEFYVHYPGLISIDNFGFNPVDGFQVKQSFKLRWAIDSVNLFRLQGMAGYAINRGAFFGSGKANLQYARLKRAQLELTGGYLTRDFNTHDGIPELLNSVYNLFLKQNYLLSYHDTYIKGLNYFDLTNGLTSKVGLKYQKIDSLGNSTNFSILYPNKDYPTNTPNNSSIEAGNLSSQKLLGVELGLAYTPRQHYRIEKGIKHLSYSKWPTFSLSYEGSIPLNSDYANYQMMEFGIRQSIDIYSTAQFRYSIKAGGFFQNHQMHFSAFKHFKTIEELFTNRRLNESYALLQNYEYSTNKNYIEGHLKYTSDFLLLKHLPIISNQVWKENIFFDFLATDRHYPYYELGYSLSEIFFVGELGVFVGFKGSEFHMVGVKARFEF